MGVCIDQKQDHTVSVLLFYVVVVLIFWRVLSWCLDGAKRGQKTLRKELELPPARNIIDFTEFTTF